MTATAPGTDDGPVDRRHHVSDYFRLERWEIPPPDGSGRPSGVGGRAPVDDHLRGPGGGLRTGALLTSIDSLGGLLSGLTVLPRWIVTTSLLATVSRLAHVGPLRLEGEVLRRGRNSVVSTVDVVDEGEGGRHVAAATLTCAVLDAEGMELAFDRPFALPTPPLQQGAPAPDEFFCIEPGEGATTRLVLADRLRNPWGILHGGGVAMLADEAACRAARAADPGAAGPRGVAAADTVLHYLRPVRVGPAEARCEVLGTHGGRTLVRVAVHDLGAGDRLVSLGSVVVLAV